MTGSRERVLSGMRPTGKLHLGNYLGALENWVQAPGRLRVLLLRRELARAHHRPAATAARSRGDTIEMARGLARAPGSIPSGRTLFIQSLVPEHAELHLLFSMVTPVGWLERVPTYKEMVEQLGIESPSYGLLGYPLLQSADILMYKAAVGAGGRRPGAARRADARGGAPLQQHVDAGLPGAARPS